MSQLQKYIDEVWTRKEFSFFSFCIRAWYGLVTLMLDLSTSKSVPRGIYYKQPKQHRDYYSEVW